MRIGPKLMGVIAESLLTVATPSFAQAIKKKIVHQKPRWMQELVEYKFRTFQGDRLDFMANGNLKPNSRTLELGFGVPKVITFNRVKCACLGPGEEIASLNLDFAGIAFEKDYKGKPVPSFTTSADVTTAPFLKGKHFDLRASNFFKLIAGDKVLTGMDTTKSNIPGEYIYENHSGTKNLFGPLLNINLGRNNGFQANAMIGLASESGEKAGVGFKAGFIKRIFNNFFGFGNVQGTIGRNKTEFQAGAAYRLNLKKR